MLTIGSFGEEYAWGGLRLGWVAVPRLCSDGSVRSRPAPTSALLCSTKRWQLGSSTSSTACGTTGARNSSPASRLTTDFLERRLPDWQWQPPTGGVSLWVRLPRGTSRPTRRSTFRHGVEVIPGDVMSPAGGHGEYFRLPFTAPTDVLGCTLERLADAWARLYERHDVRPPRSPPSSCDELP